MNGKDGGFRFFSKNLGSIDRMIRIFLSLGILNLALFGLAGGIPDYAIILVSGALIMTGLCGWCPLYAVFGLRSARPS